MCSLSTLRIVLALLALSVVQPLQADGIVLSPAPIPIHGTGIVDFAQYDAMGGTRMAGLGSNGLDRLDFEIGHRWPVLPGSIASGDSWVMTLTRRLVFNGMFYQYFHYSIGGPNSFFILYDSSLQEVGRVNVDAYFIYKSLQYVPDAGHLPIIQGEFAISPTPPVPEPGTFALVLTGVAIVAIKFRKFR